MKMTIHGKQLVITDAIKNYAETKLEGLKSITTV